MAQRDEDQADIEVSQLAQPQPSKSLLPDNNSSTSITEETSVEPQLQLHSSNQMTAKDCSSKSISELQNHFQSITSNWLAAIKSDFLEIQELMNTNNQINQDFNDWVEAGAIDSLTRQEKVLRSRKKSIHLLEDQAVIERDRMDSAVLEMKKITDQLVEVEPNYQSGNPDSPN